MGKRGGGKPAPAKGNKNNDFEREVVSKDSLLPPLLPMYFMKQS